MKVIEQLEQHFMERETKAVDSVLTISGFSFAGRGQNMGLAFVKLKDWHLRETPDLKAPAIAGRAMKAFSQIRDGMAFAFSPPAVVELGQANGFDLQLQDRGGLGHEKLMEARNQLLGVPMKVNPVKLAVGKVAAKLLPRLALPPAIPNEFLSRDPEVGRRRRRSPTRSPPRSRPTRPTSTCTTSAPTSSSCAPRTARASCSRRPRSQRDAVSPGVLPGRCTRRQAWPSQERS